MRVCARAILGGALSGSIFWLLPNSGLYMNNVRVRAYIKDKERSACSNCLSAAASGSGGEGIGLRR